MNAKRLFIILIAALALTIFGLVGATYGMASLLQSKSKELANTKAEVAQLNTQQTGLAKSKRDIAKYAEFEKITDSIVPQDKDQAQTVREITKIASVNSISLTSITFPSSTLGAGAAGPAGAPAAAAAAKPNLSQLTPVKNIPGVYNLQITVSNNANNTVTFSQFDALLRGLENNRRTAAVSSVSIQPQPNNPNRLIFTLVINTYIKPS